MKTARMESIVERFGALGPYVAVALLLPGGTVFALLFWLYQRIQRQRQEHVGHA